LHDEDGTKKIFGGEVRGTILLGIRLTEFLEVAVSEFEELGIVLEVLIEPLVFCTEVLYNLDGLGFVVVVAKEAGQ